MTSSDAAAVCWWRPSHRPSAVVRLLDARARALRVANGGVVALREECAVLLALVEAGAAVLRKAAARVRAVRPVADVGDPEAPFGAAAGGVRLAAREGEHGEGGRDDGDGNGAHGVTILTADNAVAATREKTWTKSQVVSLQKPREENDGNDWQAQRQVLRLVVGGRRRVPVTVCGSFGTTTAGEN